MVALVTSAALPGVPQLFPLGAANPILPPYWKQGLLGDVRSASTHFFLVKRLTVPSTGGMCALLRLLAKCVEHIVEMAQRANPISRITAVFPSFVLASTFVATVLLVLVTRRRSSNRSQREFVKE